VDRIFSDDNQRLADSFFSLFRSIIERARRSNTPIYNNLRLIFSYSTKDISQFASDPIHSPFNIGRAVSIAGFDEKQIEKLSKNAYDLNLSPEQLTDLKRLVGGHPYLIQIALSELKKNEQTPGYFDKLMKEAATDLGIYRIHLAELYRQLQQQPELLQTFQEIISSESEEGNASPFIFRGLMRFMPGAQDFDRDIPKLQSALESLGLIKFQDDKCVPRCKLYQDYFQKKL
jgi:tetratricopeptide (TPR) repeat protein